MSVKFGLTEKERILQLAREEDDEPCMPSTSQPSTETAVLQAAIKKGKEFFQALDVTLRPVAPFIKIKPKLPRVLRQKVIDKLTGEHLALEAILNTDIEAPTPATIAANAALVKRIISTALEQEADMYARCSSAQVYQNLASRCSALDWRKEVRAAAKAEKAYEELLAAQRVEEEKRGLEEKNLMSAGDRFSMKRKVQVEESTRTKLSGSNKKQNSKLIESDLDWDKAKPDTSDDKERQKLRHRVMQALENCPKWSLLPVDQRVTTVERCMLKVIDTKRIDDAALQRLTGQYIDFMINKTKRTTQKDVDL